MNMFGDSGSLALPFAVTVTVCAVSALFLLWRHWPRGASAEASEEPARVETFRGPMPEGAAPKDGVFTMETLKKFDGVELPMLVGICGKVVNVSSSENFNPGIGYGKLWAGSDSTYAMAKVTRWWWFLVALFFDVLHRVPFVMPFRWPVSACFRVCVRLVCVDYGGIKLSKCSGGFGRLGSPLLLQAHQRFAL